MSRAPVRSSAMTAILILCMLGVCVFMVSTGGYFGEKSFLAGFSWVWLGFIVFIFHCVIVTIVAMSTIMVKEGVKEELLRYATELQLKLGRRVDYNEAIQHLLRERRKFPALLKEACEPIPGADEDKEMLYEERKRDDRES